MHLGANGDVQDTATAYVVMDGTSNGGNTIYVDGGVGSKWEMLQNVSAGNADLYGIKGNGGTSMIPDVYVSNGSFIRGNLAGTIGGSILVTVPIDVAQATTGIAKLSVYDGPTTSPACQLHLTGSDGGSRSLLDTGGKVIIYDGAVLKADHLVYFNGSNAELDMTCDSSGVGSEVDGSVFFSSAGGLLTLSDFTSGTVGVCTITGDLTESSSVRNNFDCSSSGIDTIETNDLTSTDTMAGSLILSGSNAPPLNTAEAVLVGNSVTDSLTSVSWSGHGNSFSHGVNTHSGAGFELDITRTS
jgi:hypothetical protein